MDKQPLVSILTTSYNREKFIAEAIESVLASSHKNFEYIIVDDGSTDNTVSIIKKYVETDKRIRFYQNEKNLGDYPNRNKAASYAKGEFIMFVDSDDTICQDGAENCVRAMLQFPEASFGMFYADFSQEAFCLKPNAALRQHFFQKPFLVVGPGGTILRREFFERIGKYPVEFGPANDMFFNLKATCYTSVLLLPFTFMNYRRHEGQEVNNKYAYLYNNYKFYKKAVETLPLPLLPEEKAWISKKNKRRFFINILKYLKRTRNVPSAIKAIKKANYSLKDAVEGIFH